MDHISLNYLQNVLEPCAGNRAIANRISGKVPGVWTNDIDKEAAPGANWNEDAVDINAEMWTAQRWDWIISNPPYNQANRIVSNALLHCNKVAMLLRLSFLEPTRDRYNLLNENILRYLIIIGQPRPSFTGDGKTDSVTHAWFVWDKNYTGQTNVIWEVNWI